MKKNTRNKRFGRVIHVTNGMRYVFTSSAFYLIQFLLFFFFCVFRNAPPCHTTTPSVHQFGILNSQYFNFFFLPISRLSSSDILLLLFRSKMGFFSPSPLCTPVGADPSPPGHLVSVDDGERSTCNYINNFRGNYLDIKTAASILVAYLYKKKKTRTENITAEMPKDLFRIEHKHRVPFTFVKSIFIRV